MASQAYKDMLSGTKNDWDGAFQYSTPQKAINYSSFISDDYSNAVYQASVDSVNKRNMELRNQQTAFNNQQKMLKSLATGAASGGGDVGAPSTTNRFEAGLSDAETRLRSLLDNPDSIQQTAAYKFRVGQGQEALQRQMAAKGMLNSGNRLMELTKYGQDMGSQEYDNQFGRIKDLVGGYSGSWIGDKNANTGIYNAQNVAKANNQRHSLGLANLAWEMNKPTSVSGGGRSSGGGYSRDLYTSSPNPDLSNVWDYNRGSYDGNTSAYTNALTGQQQIRRG